MANKEINAFIIYDVGQKRVAKVHKLLSSYLFWEQNSVFSGNVSPKVLKRVLFKVNRLVDPRQDCVYCYRLKYPFTLHIERWGKYANKHSEIIRM
ncbi:CRISPR-associated endonuclease Cas2 [Thermovirga sp.]|uniref:CRISPR-associated endonuclease Cas2 n=1 Tax=Thermovirga sp. TaxID=2699834 RepID=UPI0025D7048F|nr:CRISPR-associated endonuclease Cas2 [Thermovirga sp.]MBO8154752.1 CRISPR-associated endonuclease Cas2 [Thermovirga sp.]